ncbi:MAG: GAF domain-containing protein [Solirubrobacteraceae bacterium]
MPASALPLRHFAGLVLVTVVIAVIEATGRAPGLDPAVLLPMAILAGAAFDGLVGGGLAAVVGGMYLGLYYTDPTISTTGSFARILVGLASSALAVLVALALRDRAHVERERGRRRQEESAAVLAFAQRLGAEPPETLGTAVVQAAAQLLDADMAVLTLLDPPSGRHVVRAALVGSSSPVGVEVPPGVGVTGQAIRERRLVMAAGPDPGGVLGLQRRLRGRTSAHTMAAVPALQAGRVIATLTVGRADGVPFGVAERQMLEATGPLITLAVSGSLVWSEAEEGSPHDGLTGL